MAKSIPGHPLWRMVELGVGRAFQHAELFPHLTVMENLSDRPPPFVSARCVHERAVFRPCAGRRGGGAAPVSKALSTSSRSTGIATRRSACCPTACRRSSASRGHWPLRPKLLLLDEPSTGLIREERENLARFLLRIVHDFGPTIVWVEHDMQMVSDLADRVVVLNHGSKIAEGAPRDVAALQEVVVAYLGQADPSQSRRKCWIRARCGEAGKLDRGKSRIDREHLTDCWNSSAGCDDQTLTTLASTRRALALTLCAYERVADNIVDLVAAALLSTADDVPVPARRDPGEILDRSSSYRKAVRRRDRAAMRALGTPSQSHIVGEQTSLMHYVGNAGSCAATVRFSIRCCAIVRSATSRSQLDSMILRILL